MERGEGAKAGETHGRRDDALVGLQNNKKTSEVPVLLHKPPGQFH